MAELFVNDIWRLRAFCGLQNQTAINVLHFRVVASTGGGVTDQFAVTTLSLLLEDEYKALLCSAATFKGLNLQRVSPTPATAPVSEVGNSGPGLVTGDPLPKQVCGVITFKTAFAGRKFRGRIYSPFPSETDNDADSTPINTYVTRLATLGTQFISEIQLNDGTNTSNIRFGVFHRATTTIDNIVTRFANDRWGTQRRRGDYGRTNVNEP